MCKGGTHIFMENIEKPIRGISGSTLKIIAISTMLIDHIGATIMEEMVYALSGNYGTMISMFNLMLVMRIVGRLAFPIFCYLLVEGFLHTKDVKKYALRLFIFALISEIPFDFAINKTFFELGHQNVFFTLLIGILAMYGIDFFTKHFQDNKKASSLSRLAVALAAMFLAELLRCDYSSLGIAVILLLYIFHDNKTLKILSVCFIFVLYSVLTASILQAFAGFAFVPLYFYNGKKGFSMKYFFYAFYPVHLLILGIIVNYMS